MRSGPILLDDYGMFLLNHLLDVQEDVRLLRHIEDEMLRKLLQHAESNYLNQLFTEWVEYIILLCASPDVSLTYTLETHLMLSETIVEVAHQCVPRQVNLRQTPSHKQARDNKLRLFKLLFVVWDEAYEARTAQEKMLVNS